MADLTQATLSWNANTEPDLDRYRVYFSQVPTSFVLFNDVDAPATSLVITGGSFTNDGIWYFVISAFDLVGNESPKSAAVSKRIIRQQSVIRHRR